MKAEAALLPTGEGLGWLRWQVSMEEGVCGGRRPQLEEGVCGGLRHRMESMPPSARCRSARAGFWLAVSGTQLGDGDGQVGGGRGGTLTLCAAGALERRIHCCSQRVAWAWQTMLGVMLVVVVVVMVVVMVLVVGIRRRHCHRRRRTANGSGVARLRQMVLGVMLGAAVGGEAIHSSRRSRCDRRCPRRCCRCRR